MKQQKRMQSFFRISRLTALLAWAIVFCLMMTGISLGAILVINGPYHLVIDQSYVSGEAGNEIQDTVLSPINQINISVRQAQGQNWEVEIRRVDSVWLPQLQLSVIRHSDGVGINRFSWVSGGTQFVPIDEQDSLLFNGWGNRNSMGLQLKLSGLSTSIPAGNYMTTLVYTLIETF
ncbi:MAG: hypothetical protein MUP70_16095 [Candidatus Aminicenantes bacterium]|nr:hypothetical protein [Candidatus Aminicenantes bacterium]